MATFVLVTKLNDNLLKQAEDRRAAGAHWLKTVKELCPGVRWISHFALLGRFDFLDIYEVDNVEMAQKIALLTRTLGAKEVETWQATPYEDFLNVLEQVNQTLEHTSTPL